MKLTGLITVEKIRAAINALYDDLPPNPYPVGALYWSSQPTDPGTLFGGTWTQIKDKFILAAGDTYQAGSNGGEANVTLEIDQIPMHKHSASATSSTVSGSITVGRLQNVGSSGAFSHTNTSNAYCGNTDWGGYITTFNLNSSFASDISIDNTGGSAEHNNMPPYVTYYCWERIE